MTLCISCMMFLISVSSDLRNFLRAGTLKKRFLTVNDVPAAHCTGSCRSTFDAAISISVPTSSVTLRVRTSTCATAAIEARASPLKPMVCSAKRSLASRIFDVACRSNAMRASLPDIPLPLSITCIDVRPAPLMMTLTCVAPASIEFSTSSLTTEAGRCITSPAAIWFATASGSRWIISLISLFWK